MTLAAFLRQGASNEDSVTVWFFARLWVYNKLSWNNSCPVSCTHNWNSMVSRGAAATNGGSKVKVPLLPTRTVWVVPSSEAGVGAGDPGYEEYTVVHWDASTVTVTVTRLSTGAAGMVTPPYAAVVYACASVVVAGGVATLAAVAAEADEASAFSCAPIANAADLKLENELAEPSAGQLTAKTIPAPQWLAAVFAAWSQNTQMGLV